jgi:hypothetical protein
MVKPVGGRGHTAPYETTHVRVPVPIKDKVEQLIEDYRKSILTGDASIDSDRSEQSEEQETGSLSIEFNESLEIAKHILSLKKSSKVSLAKLLSRLYKVEVKPEDLTR